MSFLLRAALVIGTLSYFAAMRGEPGRAGPPEPAGLRGALPAGPLPADLPAVWNAVPAEARDRIARAAMAELARRAGEPEPAPPPRDTLVPADRQPPWRGVDGREGGGR